MSQRSAPDWKARPLALRGAFAGLLLLAVGMFVITRTASIAYYTHSFGVEGVRTDATIVKLSSHQGGRGTYYFVTYRYLDSRVTVHSSRTEVAPIEWKGLSENGIIPIIYLQSSPDVNRMNLPADQYYYQQEGGLTALLFGGFLSLVGAALAGICWWGRNSPSNKRSTSSSSRHQKAFHKTY